MSLTSLSFLTLVAVCAAGYYLIPVKYQWSWLLLFSMVYYYAAAGIGAFAFILFTIITTYSTGRLLDPETGHFSEKGKKAILITCLLADFGMLAILKYSNFAIVNINALTGSSFHLHDLLLPLGISFYTFQSMGYLLDVYWERAHAEKNFFRFALFVSFFPQILQGPISRFHQLAGELFAEHHFDGENFSYGLQLILYGYFKKLVLADRAGHAVDIIFSNYTNYSGIVPILGVLLYSIQLYMDFSGGMDVVMGVAQLFGISLTPNFRRPYFAVSITDFWHRWHITLGTWMKDYVFIPISISRWMNKVGKWARKVFGKNVGRKLPMSLANIIVFLLVGIWHGPAWKYIAYGLYNGLIIAGSNLAEPLYRKGRDFFHISAKSSGWHIVQILRTFLLVNISWFFDMAPDLPAAFYMMRSIFTGFTLRIVADGTFASLDLSMLDIAILLAGTLFIFIISVLQERGTKIRESLARRPLVLRWALLLILLITIPLFGYVTEIPGGFLYAQF